ncbi:MAG: hypothetical protein AVO33_01585 [delta proteobacterium ML8_F1]|nr:MAG: hypothetical protein AVO33_01585 [delta proteobacterium ML8_F1]
MSQGIVSVVISEELLLKIDSLARKKRQSRSKTINEILGEYFELMTPEAKIDRVMDEIALVLGGNHFLQTLSKTKGSSIQCRGDIQYKYNPKIRYMLQLDGKSEHKLATLHVVPRTRQEEFTRHLAIFFSLLQAVEAARPPDPELRALKAGAFVFDGKKFTRDFYTPWQEDHLTVEKIADFLGSYMLMIHEAMNRYFNSIQETRAVRYASVASVFSDFFRR